MHRVQGERFDLAGRNLADVSRRQDGGEAKALGAMAEPFTLATSGPSEFAFSEVALAPGQSTGWHCHPGEVFVVVRSGVLTRYEADGTRRMHAAGEAFIEWGGRERIHMGCNQGAVPVTLHLMYVNPAGSPLSVSCAAPRRSTTPVPAGVGGLVR